MIANGKCQRERENRNAEKYGDSRPRIAHHNSQIGNWQSSIDKLPSVGFGLRQGYEKKEFFFYIDRSRNVIQNK
jgi:hypothetical protein